MSSGSPYDTKEQVRAAVDIVDLVGHRIGGRHGLHLATAGGDRDAGGHGTGECGGGAGREIAQGGLGIAGLTSFEIA